MDALVRAMAGVALVVLLLGPHLAWAQAEWDQTTPFKKEESPINGVVFVSSTKTMTQIHMPENMNGADYNLIGIPIAIMTYNGDLADGPEITGFEESKTNEDLGVKPEKDKNGIWHLVITKPQDFEKPSQQTYRFYYDIGSGTGTVMSHRVALNFDDVDDNAPSISLAQNKCEMDENVHGDTSKKCFFDVFDADSNGMENLKYEVKDSVMDTNLFEIVTDSVIDKHNSKAVLKVNAPGLDFEEFSLLILSITVNDTANNQGSPYSCVVQVNDLPDQNPVWKTIFASENVKELDERIIPVLAVDGDVIINAKIWYKLDPLEMLEDHRKYFTIDQETGDLTVSPINRDELMTEVFKFNVTAYEKDDPTSFISSTVIIIVDDLNNNWPTIIPEEPLATTIDEGAAVQLDLNITVKDPDLGENGQFSIRLEDPSGLNRTNSFMVIPSNGYQTTAVVISVTNAAALDFEDPDMQIITLKIVATEVMNKTHVGSREVVVTLKDINDEFPVFAKDAFTASVPENAKKGDNVTIIQATDKDLEDHDKLKHVLTSGQQMLSIDSLSGVITVKQNYAFDHEMQSQLIVQVMAEDLAAHKTYVQLTITVDDVNDTPPTLEMPINPPNVKEQSPVGMEIENATIRAVDLDLDAELLFSIDWKKSFATKQGARVSNRSLYDECIEVSTSYDSEDDHTKATGTLMVKEMKLNWVDFDTLVLQIVVTDSMTLVPEFEAKKQSSASLTLTVEDINNFAPEFTQESLNAQRQVLELSGTNQLIGSVIAIDRDGPGFNDITYRLEEADLSWPTGLVKIDPTNGELRVAKDGGIVLLDGVNKTLKYKVIASDSDKEGLAKIEIAVIDTNNNKPQIILENDTFYRSENTPSGNLITRIIYTDADVREEYKTASFFLDPKENPKIKNLLSIDIASGELRVDLKDGAVLDRDAPDGQASYDIKILLRDNWEQGNSAPSLENTATIKLILTDVNDNVPKFRNVDGCLASPMENTTQNTIISTDVFADDVDDGLNGQVTYFVDGFDAENRTMEGLPDKLFSIDPVGGQVRVLENLGGLWGTYNLHLLAKDNPEDASNQSVTPHTFKICVQDINDNSPVFVYPESGKIIRLRQSQSIGGDLIETNNKTMPLIEASDEDDGDNSLVTISLGAGEATNFFEVDNNVNERNKAKLKLIKDLDSPSRVFEVIFIATDAGTPPLISQSTVSIKFVPDGNPPPMFNVREDSTSFWENERGVQQQPFQLPEAKDDDNESIDITDPNWETVYYHIIGATSDSDTGSADALGVFVLDKLTGELGLKVAVDREATPSFTVTVLATSNDRPPASPTIDPTDRSQITITVTIDDENDSPPEFEKEIFSGGIAMGDKNGVVVLTVKASDPDLNDPLTYEMFGPINVSDSSLNNIKDRAFSLNKKSGDLNLLFDPNDQMSGFFEFQVKATDSSPDGGDNHVDTAGVKVFIISISNRVTFRFRNDITTVEDSKSEMMDIFSDVMDLNCTIDSVASAVDDDGARLKNQTDVVAHFINSTKNEAVGAAKITEILSNRETMNELQSRFWELRLDLFDFPRDNTVSESLEGLLQIVLIVVSVVLGSLVVILFAAFFLKTRSLNRRLEALSTTKFGSQDSGLNRVGMAVPNTNKHAVEGSNPVWNEDFAAKDYDIRSENSDSDDSDLIGDEDRPEFETTPTTGEAWGTGGTINGGYQSDAAPRRVSLNPLTMDGLGDGARRVSVNPLNAHHMDMDSPDEDEFGNPEHSNFSFGIPLSIPTTEL